MNATTKNELAALQGEDEENCNTSANPSLMDVVEQRLSRRNMLRVGFGSAGAFFSKSRRMTSTSCCSVSMTEKSSSGMKFDGNTRRPCRFTTNGCI